MLTQAFKLGGLHLRKEKHKRLILWSKQLKKQHQWKQFYRNVH